MRSNKSLKKITHRLAQGITLLIAASVVSIVYGIMLFVAWGTTIASAIATKPFLLLLANTDIKPPLFFKQIISLHEDIVIASIGLINSIRHNARYLTIDFSNRILENFKFSTLSLQKRISAEQLEEAVLKRSHTIKNLTSRYNKNTKAYIRMVKEVNGAQNLQTELYQEATKKFLDQLLEEYKIYLSEQRLDVSRIIFNDDPLQLQELTAWYILRTRERLITWTLSDEFALLSMQKDKDDFVAGLTPDQIKNLEKNDKWCCKISSGLMRNPVYVVLSNGERIYYDYSNIAKWMSRAVSKPDERQTTPHSREPINELFFDFKLQAEIQAAIDHENNPNNTSRKDTLEEFRKPLFMAMRPVKLVYNIFKMFLDIPPKVSSNDLEQICDPFQKIKLKDYDHLPVLERQPPLWQKVLENRPNVAMTIEEYMLQLEVEAGLIIEELQGYFLFHNDQMIPLYRYLRSARTQDVRQYGPVEDRPYPNYRTTNRPPFW